MQFSFFLRGYVFFSCDSKLFDVFLMFFLSIFSYNVHFVGWKMQGRTNRPSIPSLRTALRIIVLCFFDYMFTLSIFLLLFGLNPKQGEEGSVASRARRDGRTGIGSPSI